MQPFRRAHATPSSPTPLPAPRSRGPVATQPRLSPTVWCYQSTRNDILWGRPCESQSQNTAAESQREGPRSARQVHHHRSAAIIDRATHAYVASSRSRAPRPSPRYLIIRVPRCDSAGGKKKCPMGKVWAYRHKKWPKHVPANWCDDDDAPPKPCVYVGVLLLKSPNA